MLKLRQLSNQQLLENALIEKDGKLTFDFMRMPVWMIQKLNKVEGELTIPRVVELFVEDKEILSIALYNAIMSPYYAKPDLHQHEVKTETQI